MYCTSCGKQINDDASFCQYCGAPQKGQPTSYRPNVQQQPYQQQNATQQTIKDLKDSEPKTYPKVLSILGFAISIFSLFFSMAGFSALAAIILSIIGLAMGSKDNITYRIFAIIGICIGGFSELAILLFYI